MDEESAGGSAPAGAGGSARPASAGGSARDFAREALDAAPEGASSSAGGPAVGGPAEVEMEVDEQRRPVVVKAPHLPSAQEREEHELTGHVCYRNWCPICLACKGLGQGHRDAPAEDETAVPTLLCDYAFVGQDDGKTLPMVCAKDKKDKESSSVICSKQRSRSIRGEVLERVHEVNRLQKDHEQE